MTTSLPLAEGLTFAVIGCFQNVAVTYGFTIGPIRKHYSFWH